MKQALKNYVQINEHNQHIHTNSSVHQSCKYSPLQVGILE